MYSNRLIQSIENHWEEIAAAAIRRIRKEEHVPHIQKLSDVELQNWAHDILNALQWKALGNDDKTLTSEYQELGRLRFETSVNLYEVVRCLHILKIKIIEFVRNRGFAQNSMEVYAQEELEHCIGLFFDWALYNIVRGYEEAQQRAAQLGR